MHDFIATFLITGWLNVSWWQLVLFTLGMTHVTIAAVTIFLHRAQAHRALELGPIPAHFFRFWLWLTTGMVTREWVAIHRKHHAKCETPDDPHSPIHKGIDTVLLRGTELYRSAAKVRSTLERYGHRTPDDWLERHLYSRHTKVGIGLMFAIDLLLFGVIGITVWAVQMAWIPVMAAGVINGVGHYQGYRNFETDDASTNIVPWGILIGGEELHNNHHTYPTAAKLSVKPYEFDIGWLYIRCLEWLGWARVRRQSLPPKLQINWARHGLLIKSVEHIETLRHEVVAQLVQLERTYQPDETVTARLKRFREGFKTIWQQEGFHVAELREALQRWCDQAGNSGIPELSRLASELPGWEVRR